MQKIDKVELLKTDSLDLFTLQNTSLLTNQCYQCVYESCHKVNYLNGDDNGLTETVHHSRIYIVIDMFNP